MRMWVQAYVGNADEVEQGRVEPRTEYSESTDVIYC